MAEFDKVLDNKNHQAFETGSIRDSAEGKGTPYLIAGEVLSEIIVLEDEILHNINKLLLGYNKALENDGDKFRRKGVENIEAAFRLTLEYLIKEENGSYFEAMRRFSQHYENGAKKYSPNNWRKGQPISRYYDSAYRHLCRMVDGDKKEDHTSALLWNLACIIQTKRDIERGYLPEKLNDFPFTKKELFEKEAK
ncbi:MAG: DUF5664 domain-containing protein [Clostridia bacterium]|nr:DUF5664 domain-containing protein [Clostridia bacterium]